LTVTIAAADRALRVCVADDGPGIASENLEKIFEPFFTTKGEKGTGVGLWVTRSIIEDIGGGIEVTSSTRPGRSGTSFTVTIPWAQSRANGDDGQRLPKASAG